MKRRRTISLGSGRRLGPIFYRYSVLYRDVPGGPVKREILDSVTVRDAIRALQVMMPWVVDVAASKIGPAP